MRSFREWMSLQTDCEGPIPCCKTASFPFNDSTFAFCSRKFLRLAEKLSPTSETKTLGPMYFTNGSARSMIVEVASTYPYSHSYTETRAFYDTVEAWLQTILDTAPHGLSRGWFHSRLDFFDLQDSLLNGTATSICISLAVAFAVLLLTTLNVGVSVLSIVTVVGIITATIAVLVLLDWQLGVFESATIGLATGLSFDFALHFAVSFCMAEV